VFLRLFFSVFKCVSSHLVDRLSVFIRHEKRGRERAEPSPVRATGVVMRFLFKQNTNFSFSLSGRNANTHTIHGVGKGRGGRERFHLTIWREIHTGDMSMHPLVIRPIRFAIFFFLSLFYALCLSLSLCVSVCVCVIITLCSHHPIGLVFVSLCIISGFGSFLFFFVFLSNDESHSNLGEEKKKQKKLEGSKGMRRRKRRIIYSFEVAIIVVWRNNNHNYLK
jgi:hypothetical protein